MHHTSFTRFVGAQHNAFEAMSRTRFYCGLNISGVGAFPNNYLCQFGIKEIRYANYRVAGGLVVGEGKHEKAHDVAIGKFTQTMFLSTYSSPLTFQKLSPLFT